jgi:hypothetical protein
MTKKISDILQNTPKPPPLKDWPSETPKKSNVKKAEKTLQPTRYRLHVWFKPEYQKIRNGKPQQDWFWNGLHLLEKLELQHRTTFPGELQAIAWKLRQIYFTVIRVVVYDKRPDRTSDILFEWTKKHGQLVNITKIDFRAILEE